MTKQELASTIWASANKMRSSRIEPNDYKDYVLGILFYRFLSENEENYCKKKRGTKEDLREISADSEDANTIKESIGYFIAYDNLFSSWREKEDFNISDVSTALNVFDNNIAKERKRVFNNIFSTLKQGLDKFGDSSTSPTAAIKELINLIATIPIDDNQDYDVLGFIYENLIGNFAANAGKKGGEFYTPHEVSVVMSEIVAEHLKDCNDEINVYDSTSGSGSLLITIGKSVSKRLNNPNAVCYYAQEKIEATYNLTRMNLIMRGILPENIIVRCGDTLHKDWPLFDEDDYENTYEPLVNIDAVVGNPPYSQHWDRDDHESDDRYRGYGLAPETKADYAFLLHDLYHLRPETETTPGGIMTIVLPHGVLFRGNKDDGNEGTIRKQLIEKNNIDAIIGLPANIFYGTGIPTIIMVLKKGRKASDVLFIDASKGFTKDGNKNKLRARDIKKIVDTYVERREEDKYSRVVTREEIRANDYNLNIPRYVDSNKEPEKYDLYALMNGGIPKTELSTISNELRVFKSLYNELFVEDSSPYLKLRVEEDSIIDTIANNNDVKEYENTVSDAFSDFGRYLYIELIDNVETLPLNAEEDVIADEIFRRLENIPLLDKYEAYQHLDDEWKIISRDIETIQTEGKQAVAQVDPFMVTKKDKKEKKDIEVQDGWVGHIIPFELIQQDLMADTLDEIKSKENRLEEISEEFDEICEEIEEEDKKDIYDDEKEKFDNSKIKKLATLLQKGKQTYQEDTFEYQVIQLSNLLKEKSSLSSSIKKSKDEIDEKTKDIIERLTFEDATKYLVKKWIEPLTSKLLSMPETIVDSVEGFVTSLNNKYKETMYDIENGIEETERELSNMLDDLTGDEYDMQGIKDLKTLLGKDKK